MKILLISASAKENGSTAYVIKEAEKVLKESKVEYKIFNLYTSAIKACCGCGMCKKAGRCIYEDEATKLSDICGDFDGYMFFSPVHYGGASGTVKAAMGRLFYSKKKSLEYKPAAAIAVSRRAGNITAIEEMSRFFYFASMPIVSGSYPGVIYGTTKEEIENDTEGLNTVRSITKNMIWLIRSINAGKCVEIFHP